ncbi:MAG: purine nucleoside permease [Pseudomonadota bacterium]
MTSRIQRLTVLVSLLISAVGCTEDSTTIEVDEVIRPKVVVVTMFERGADSGDAAGEFQLWNERRELNTIFESGTHHNFHYNPESQILGIVTGIGTAKAAASIMALGMDPRFDLNQSYWLVAGIAGFDPEDASLGSVAWAEYLVDGDIAHEIDVREKPDDWEWGYIERHVKTPFQQPRREPNGEVYQINGALADWAYELTRDVELFDSKELKASRARFTQHEMAQVTPFVLKGDHLAASTFWHGEILNAWANAWVDHWSEGNGEFVSSAMEETGTMQSITYLDRMGRVDKDRVLVLRGASNYTVPPPGVTPADNLLSENDGYSGMNAALENLYRVGSVVIDELLIGWTQYQNCVPGDCE